MTTTTETGRCPSCGRYTGPYEACPYCGARLTGRLSMRLVKTVAVLLSTVGLILLWWMATRAEVPLISIGQAGATMNMAYVRLIGHCTRPPSYDPESDYMSFWISDDTGEIRISAYREETQQIISEGRIPGLGDLVEVAGTLRVREDFLAMTINAPQQLIITRTAPVERAIGSIEPADQYLRVRVQGQVREIYTPYEGLTLITVRDETGAIPVAVSDELAALSGVTPTITTSQAVEVIAAVSLYGDTPQLIPATTADIRPLSQAPAIAEETPIAVLTESDVGRLVRIRGTITRVEPFSSGVKLRVDDGSGTLVVLLWKSLYDELPHPHTAQALDVGAEVTVQGALSQYRGTLELTPELADDIHILAQAPPPEVMTVGDLRTVDVGRVITLQGVLGPPEPFSAGVKFTLDDGSGQIILLLWNDVYAEAPADLDAGAEVRVTGEVAEYRGGLELVPRHGGEIEFLGQRTITPPSNPTPTSTPETPPAAASRPIGKIGTADVGTTVTVVGVLGEMETFSAGVKFPLTDESGTIVLLLWQDVYDLLPGADRLVEGVRVAVTGEVETYRGTLEVIPSVDGVVVLP